MIQELTVIGVMSGTSLDGLDLCAVKLWQENARYNYEFIAGETIPYSDQLRNSLGSAMQLSQESLQALDHYYGFHIGVEVQNFIMRNQLKGKVQLIGSHGHTVFHEPNKKITYQLGDGQAIANETGIETINDFRIKDVQLGGQGAPLVPIGDKLLFSEFESCLNLGGIANVSFDKNDQRIAYDLCPANLPINKLMFESFTKYYDQNGETARLGKIIIALLEELNALEYYRQDPPKSLGVEWLNANFYPILQKYDQESTEDILKTIVEHETYIIAKEFEKYAISSCLVTGGGAYNTFFMESLQSKTSTKIEIPKSELIEFKEALIFAFLAFLNFNNQINTLRSVTGAKEDSIGGKRYTPLT
ncbi:MAG: anhydro-N-acetylmuramic acid kinase [Crocinitomicaceae bacterium]|nr:anhydro-N-acetylmuramic acid kinase [Crocinitomicaceae bacterium]